MGAACCVAAKDRTITSASTVETLQRHARYSPNWSFRWDNRGRVAGEETTADWLHNGGRRNDRLEFKSSTTVETTFASDESSPLDSFRSLTWQKSPAEGNGGSSTLPSSDQAVSLSHAEVKESIDSSSVSYPSPIKLSPSVPSVSSISASPLISQSHLLPQTSTPSRWHHRSPRHQLLRQVSDSPIPEYKSPTFSISEKSSSFMPPSWGNESTRGSNGGSSDSWSIPAFSELTSTRRERWSLDSETSGFFRDKTARYSGPSAGSSSDLQACGICTKVLTERSSWGWTNQKIISASELAVVSVLTCGHVYHAECLESMTPEINKYDPACPVCTFGEKKAVKMSEKALRAELESKAKKRSRKQVVDSDLNSNFILDHHKSGVFEGRSPRISSSSSMKNAAGKPFLRRHFSFGSKTTRSTTENQSTPRKGFFWAKSSKNCASTRI